MKALITGINGLVGPYLKKELEIHGYEAFGLDMEGDGKTVFSCDITDQRAVEGVLESVQPDLIFHLAGFSSVAKSFEEPELCWKVNVEGSKILLSSRDRLGMHARVLVVSSAEVYGRPRYVPMDEDHPLDPQSPYAESRVSQEEAMKGFKEVIISRSFNHTGPGQAPVFVCSDFSKQIADIEKGLQEPVIRVGNLEAERDFTDVRDMVRAYRILLEKGRDGNTYNLCRGEPIMIKTILDKLLSLSEKQITVEKDPKRFRPVDVPRLFGTASKFKELSGWNPEIPLDKTLKDILEYWRQR